MYQVSSAIQNSIAFFHITNGMQGYKMFFYLHRDGCQNESEASRRKWNIYCVSVSPNEYLRKIDLGAPHFLCCWTDPV